ncbi:hypothetical protein [Chryseobacterium bernardetii]|uniref:hypothetical protein n=1 Tax=Chryseobacterium bernardetii TaxID=1241978 RepID=UPI00301B6B56
MMANVCMRLGRGTMRISLLIKLNVYKWIGIITGASSAPNIKLNSSELREIEVVKKLSTKKSPERSGEQKANQNSKIN